MAGVTWIGEDFLVAGEAGIENYFAATARDRACRTAVKDAAVFECKYGGAVLDVGQWILRRKSFGLGFRGSGGGERTEMIHRPIGKHGAPIDETAGNRAKHTRIIGADAMITHDKI